MKKRWINRERSQLIGFAWVLVAVGCIGGIERGNLPVGVCMRRKLRAFWSSLLEKE